MAILEMADEFKTILYGKFTRDGAVTEIGSRADVATTYATQKRIIKDGLATTSWVALSFTPLSDADELWLANLDPTHYIQLATANDDSQIFSRLKVAPSATEPGRPIRFTPEPGKTWYVKANVASCKYVLFAIEP